MPILFYLTNWHAYGSYTPLKYYRNVFIIFSLHTEMDENRCTNGIIRVANYTTFVHRFTSISVCNESNNENIPYNLITNKKYICKENALLL